MQKHIVYTGSVKGSNILDNWEGETGKFLKVMPADYEGVLNSRKRAEGGGLQGDDDILAAFEETGKVGNE